MPVLSCVSEAADWLAGADKRSTLLSVVDRFLYLDLGLGSIPHGVTARATRDMTLALDAGPAHKAIKTCQHIADTCLKLKVDFSR